MENFDTTGLVIQGKQSCTVAEKYFQSYDSFYGVYIMAYKEIVSKKEKQFHDGCCNSIKDDNSIII